MRFRSAERTAFFAEIHRDQAVLGAWLDAHPWGSPRTEADLQDARRMHYLLEDVRRRIDVDKAAHPRDYQLWSSNRVVRWFQQWRAFSSYPSD